MFWQNSSHSKRCWAPTEAERLSPKRTAPIVERVDNGFQQEPSLYSAVGAALFGPNGSENVSENVSENASFELLN